MAEWLGRALQKLVQRFESARDLEGIAMAVLFLFVGFKVGSAMHHSVQLVNWIRSEGRLSVVRSFRTSVDFLTTALIQATI